MLKRDELPPLNTVSDTPVTVAVAPARRLGDTPAAGASARRVVTDTPGAVAVPPPPATPGASSARRMVNDTPLAPATMRAPLPPQEVMARRVARTTGETPAAIDAGAMQNRVNRPVPANPAYMKWFESQLKKHGK